MSIREFESFGRTIKILQDADGATGATVWDASLVLSKYIENTDDFPPGFFVNKKCIELGSGCGLVGIVIGLLGAKIILTDQKFVMNLLRKNIETNIPSSKVTAIELNWGQDVSFLNPPFQYIFCSDVIYLEDTFDLLIKTLRDLSDQNTEILLSMEIRGKKDVKFFKKVKEFFTAEFIPEDKLDPVFRSNDICIVRMKKKFFNQSIKTLTVITDLGNIWVFGTDDFQGASTKRKIT